MRMTTSRKKVVTNRNDLDMNGNDGGLRSGQDAGWAVSVNDELNDDDKVADDNDDDNNNDEDDDGDDGDKHWSHRAANHAD